MKNLLIWGLRFFAMGSCSVVILLACIGFQTYWQTSSGVTNVEVGFPLKCYFFTVSDDGLHGAIGMNLIWDGLIWFFTILFMYLFYRIIRRKITQ